MKLSNILIQIWKIVKVDDGYHHANEEKNNEAALNWWLLNFLILDIRKNSANY